jgi:hypothetical protein
LHILTHVAFNANSSHRHISAIVKDGCVVGQHALTAAERFPFVDKPREENVKKIIWANDPALTEAR